MYIIFLILGILVIGLCVRLFVLHKNTISFFVTGIDSGFSIAEIFSLWKLAKLCDLEEPTSLYLSLPALSRSISKLLSISRSNGTEFSKNTQKLLTKLYTYRTKVELDPLSKKGLKSSKYLDEGQKLRVVLKGVGVFSSRIEMNGRELIIHVPSKNGIITMYGNEWVGQRVSIYLWRKDDACYVFDSTVIGSGQYASIPVLYISHSSDLTRVQKRKSVRSKCAISARMFLPSVKDFAYDTSLEDPSGGYRCMIEDISGDGALIRIGGKGRNGIPIKLQFSIEERFIVMAGIVRAVEYNRDLNQSRLHFECIKIEPELRNIVLSFVYNVLPQEEKEVLEAIQGTEEDKTVDEQQKDGNINTENMERKLPQENMVEEDTEEETEEQHEDDVFASLPVEDSLSNDSLDMLEPL
ncbi:MAG: PilZ domain-containing protein [Spirochaetaceae bacterium]|nr:PilZ domain-containing protein [Spirochaetaceae bacterium]